MRLRQRIEYTDGCADSVEHWPDVTEDYAEARRWAHVMEAIVPGSTALDAEQECPAHGWEDASWCERCESPTCAREICDNERECGAAVCSGCVGDYRAENPPLSARDYGVPKWGAL